MMHSMSNVDLLLLDRQLCFALYAASRAVVRAYAPLLEPLGLTYPQYLVFLVLWEQDGVAVSHLGERLALDSGTLTPLLKRLEERELIERRRSTEDERVVNVHLTADGRALRDKATTIPLQVAQCAGYDLTRAKDISEILRLREELISLTKRVA
jgi:MarR family transcriptional regulator, organic hydroperoxide resistance regulator